MTRYYVTSRLTNGPKYNEAMKKLFLILTVVFYSMSAYCQVSSKIQSRRGIVNQLEAYERVSYQGLDYYPIGKDSLIVKGEIFEKDSVIIPQTLTIDGKPYTVTGFKPSAFEYNNDIEYVSMPESITEIESSAFFHCFRLKECVMPNVRKIHASAFTGTVFTRIVFPEGIEHIGYCSFTGCNRLRYVELPKSLKYIDDMAFLGCEHLDTVKVHFTEPVEIGESVFQRVRRNWSIRTMVLSVPAGSREAFEADERWRRQFRTIVEH